MIAYRLRISRFAARLIQEEAEYYGTPVLAERWEEAVYGTIQTLLFSPDRGFACQHPTLKRQGVRRIFVAGYPYHALYFIVLKEERIVRVVDIIHGRRDVGSILKNRSEY